MSRFLASDIKTIEMNESTYPSTINSNFKRFHSVASVTPTGTALAFENFQLNYSNPLGMTTLNPDKILYETYSGYHRTVFIDTSSAGGTVVLFLPDPTIDGMGGKEIVIVRLDGGVSAEFISVTTEDITKIAGQNRQLRKEIGLRAVFSCDGSKWFGTTYDN